MSSGYTVDANQTDPNPSMTRQQDYSTGQVRVGVDGIGIAASRPQMLEDEQAQMTHRKTGGRSKKRSRRTKKRKNSKTKKSRRRRRRARK